MSGNNNMESVELEAVELDNQRNPQFGSSNAPEPGLKLNMVTTDEGFDELKSHWQKLALKTDTTIFMTHEWAKTWWNNFGRNNQRKLSILTIWDDQELVGLAPFYIGYSLIGSKRIETRLQIIGSGGSP